MGSVTFDWSALIILWGVGNDDCSLNMIMALFLNIYQQDVSYELNTEQSREGAADVPGPGPSFSEFIRRVIDTGAPSGDGPSPCSITQAHAVFSYFIDWRIETWVTRRYASLQFILSQR